MFHLTRKTDYGLILMLELSQRSLNGKAEPASLRDIAEKYCISFFFLQKVAKTLREKGLIKAARGKQGGYIPTKKPIEMTVYDVFEALEENVGIISCFNSKLPIPALATKCQMPVHKGLSLLNNELQKILKSTKVTDFFTNLSPIT